MSARPTVSVVVCAYTLDRWNDLVRGVAALGRQSCPPAQVVVVIDHCPELLDRARATFGSALVVPNTATRGLSGARNTGVAAATGDVVAFLDDDATPTDDWVERLTAPYADGSVDGDVLGTGGTARPAWPGERPAWFPPEFDWVVGCSYTGLPTAGEHPPIRNPIGAAMSFRRDVLATAGGFTDGIGRVGRTPLGCEETEFSIRAARAFPGGTIRLTPAAVVDHHVSPDRAELRYYLRRCFAEGLSKRAVSALTGADAALASERTYVTRTLPLGLARDLLVPRRWPRALAIVLGLLVTVAGYAWATVRRPVLTAAVADPAPTYRSVQVSRIELTEPVTDLTDLADLAAPAAHARVLVTHGGVPRGVVWADPVEGTLPAATLAAEVLAQVDLADLDVTADDLLAGLDAPVDAVGPVEPVTVVLCTRGRPDPLPDAIDSVLASDHPDLELLVVDNAATDDRTAELLAARYGHDPRVRLVAEPRPGLSCARNAGLAAARHDLVAFTDDDVTVDPAWLRRLAAEFADPDVAAVTGLVEPVVLDTVTQWWFEAAAGFGRGYRRAAYRLDAPPPAPLFPYELGVYGTGASMALRRSAMPEGWRFDEALGAGSPTQGGEDIDLFLDVVTTGRTLVYQPAALSFHRHRDDEAGLAKQMRGYGRGLTALLAKRLLHRAGERVLLASRVLRGIGHALSPDFRPAGDTRAPDAPPYPARLRRQEFLGMAEGPWRYVRGSRHVRGRRS